MPEYVEITPGSGQYVAADIIDDIAFQRVKVTLGDDGFNDGDVSRLNPAPTADTGCRRVLEHMLVELMALNAALGGKR